MEFKISSEVQMVEADDFLIATSFCDSQSSRLIQAVKNIIRDAECSREKARRIFYWVRDSIKYELGLNQDTASQTLQKAVGSCSNKANLLVAMLRAAGIPAGFHTMYVRGKDYLGVFCSPKFHLFMGEKSLHAYCSVFLEGQWIKVDPTDDIRLSNGIQHLCSQATAVEFDGTREARLLIDPRHVFEDHGQLLAHIDEIFQKKKRVPSIAIEVFNLYMDFLRNNCIWYSEPSQVETDFFHWLQENRPAHFQAYQDLSETLLNAQLSQPMLVPSPSEQQG